MAPYLLASPPFFPSLSFIAALVRRFAAVSTAGRAFLVIGGGPLATEFYRAYKCSINRQRLEFLALDPKRIGVHIDGIGSPTLEGDLKTKLQRLDRNYSGVIVADRIDRLHPDLLEQLVRIQFQNVRVYTLESFHEAHWRYVPVNSLDPFWPLQTGFQLARSSPFHYLKKLFDIIFAGLLLAITSPVFIIVALLIWLESGKPTIFSQTRIGRDSQTFTSFQVPHHVCGQ